ncbi:hypothetical protein ACW14X_14695 [Nocardioides sp. YJ-D4]
MTQHRPALPCQPRCHQHLGPIGITHGLQKRTSASLDVVTRGHHLKRPDQFTAKKQGIAPVVVGHRCGDIIAFSSEVRRGGGKV